MHAKERYIERGKSANFQTLFMLLVKTSTPVVEALPTLFINLLVTYSTKGVVKPSPTAPMNPKAIQNISTPSACMKMDRTDPLLFFLTSVIMSFLSLPIFR